MSVKYNESRVRLENVSGWEYDKAYDAARRNREGSGDSSPPSKEEVLFFLKRYREGR